MKRVSLFLFLFLFFGSFSVARAEEFDAPNPESRWFGVSWAVERVKHNVDVWLARTDEKKIELEISFAEKEEMLEEKINEMMESNPEASKRLLGVLEKLEQKRVRRVERVEERMRKVEERGGKLEEKLKEWREKQEGVASRSGSLKDKDLMMGKGGDLKGESSESGTIDMQGRGVKIKNARPGVIRVR
jgi:hypothetical protein